VQLSDLLAGFILLLKAQSIN